MAVFSVDLFTGNQYLLTGSFASGGTEFSGTTYNEVNLYSDLPSAADNSNKINVVRSDSGDFGPNRKESGLYYSNGDSWRHLGDVTDYLNNNNFFIYDGVDNTKGVKFHTSGITGGNIRYLTIQNLDGVVAYLSDVATKVNTSAFNTYVDTTAPSTYYNKTQINTYTAKTETYVDQIYEALSYFSSGVFNPEPELIDNGNGTATINTIDVLLYPNDDYTGTLEKHTATSKTLSFIDGAEEYVCVKLIAGVATIYKETIESNINDSNIIRVFNVWRIGDVIHSLSFGRRGVGLTNKTQDTIYHTNLYQRTFDSGLIISESNITIPRRILCTEAVVFSGVFEQQVLNYDSLTDSMIQAHRVGGNWTYLQQSGTSYNNTQWDNGVNLVTMTDDKYANRWWYRSIGGIKEVFYVLGSGEYDTPTQAENEELPNSANIPLLLFKHCMPIGKTLIQKGATSGITRSIFGTKFAGITPNITHDETSTKSGTADSILNNEFYHISANEAVQLITGGTSTGNGVGLSAAKTTDRVLGVKSLVEGTNITITSGATTVSINTKPNIQLTSLSATTISIGDVLNRNITPKGLINLYGVDNTPGDGWNVQNNNIKLDGAIDTDKDIVWQEQGQPKWAAQTFRNENGKYWYLYNVGARLNAITVYETGRIGINKQADTLNYHTIFTGSGLNDLEVSGTYSQNFNTVYEVTIASTTGATDMFYWRKSLDNGYSFSSYSSSSACTTTPKGLEQGVEVFFVSTTGHTTGTTWTFAGFSQIPQATVSIAPMDFREVLKTNDYNTDPVVYDDITANANGGSIGSTFEIFSTGTGGTKQAFIWGTAVQINSVYINIHQGGESIVLVTEYWNGTTWVALNYTNNNYIDSTENLTHGGRIIWTPNTMTGWIKSYIPDKDEDGYELYWLRITTSTNPTVAPLANGISVGNDKRLAIYGSHNDYLPNFYVDSEGRTNIGGGNITGTNVFQINTDVNTPVTSGGHNSLFEVDSDNSDVVDIKLKLSSNDLNGPGFTFVKTWGNLPNPSNTVTNSTLGRIDFRGRFDDVGSLMSQIKSIYVGTGTTKHADIVFNTSHGDDPIERVRIKHNGGVGFGLSGATAVIHIKSGSTTAGSAPLKFSTGLLLATPEAGAVEYSDNKWYGTINAGNARKTFAFLESPNFSGTVNLPSTTNLNSVSLCNYILNSGGTNNTALTSISLFNQYTGNTAPILLVATTGASRAINGLCKLIGDPYVCLGGELIYDTVISGASKNLTLSAKALNLCAVNGININSNGTAVGIRGNNSSGVEKMKLLISDTQSVFTDSRATKTGLEYAANYSSSYVDRSLVDKAYVDSKASGLNPLPSVDVATTANISISDPPATIGGVTLVSGMTVLVKNQTTGSTNGIYVFNGTGSTLTRRSDFDTSEEVVQNTLVSVITGATNKNTTWVLSTPNPINLGVDTLTWVLFSTQSGVAQGNGICVTQSGGNYVVSTKSPANSSLISDGTGIYVDSNIAGNGLCYNTGVLSIDGTALAGNSLSWTGTQFAVNTSGGTLSTALGNKLNIVTYSSYTGTTQSNINSRLLTTTYSNYTGTTAPAAFASKSFLSTYTGTTVPNTYVSIIDYNAYTGATAIAIGLKANTASPTFTGTVRSVTPAQNDNTTCIATTAWYISQGSSTNPLMDGTAAYGSSNLFTRQDHVHPSDTSRLSTASFSTYTGTTAPAAFASKSFLSTYTGTTAPNTFAPKANPTFTGVVTIPTPFTLGAVSVKTTGTELNYVTGATSNLQTQITAKTDKIKPIVSLTGNTLIDATYSDKLIEANGTFTITFPNGLSTGFRVDIINVGSGAITLAATTTLNSKLGNKRLISQWVGASVYHRGSNVWVAVGDLST